MIEVAKAVATDNGKLIFVRNRSGEPMPYLSVGVLRACLSPLVWMQLGIDQSIQAGLVQLTQWTKDNEF